MFILNQIIYDKCLSRHFLLILNFIFYDIIDINQITNYTMFKRLRNNVNEGVMKYEIIDLGPFYSNALKISIFSATIYILSKL